MMPEEQSQGISAHSAPPSGTLFLVGMPIGHPDDVTIRALTILRRVDLVAAKNPRLAQSLLSHHGIQAVLTTYSRDNAADKTPILLDRLRRGQNIALVADCGMPALYDPGRLLITAATKARIEVEVIPGPSIVAAAATLCGMDTNTFVFEGRCAGNRRGLANRLNSLQHDSRTIILLPPMQSLRTTLTTILATLGNRQVVVGLDLTQAGQRVVRGRAQSLIKKETLFTQATGAVLVVEGAGRKKHQAKTRRPD
ncbi:MAG: hypothetical protein JSR62_13305 [Nitrospira sp.]|nr:hypothetical protein [Nitrospira sp.]